jgi:lipid-binding SYLF domain-containing protein
LKEENMFNYVRLLGFFFVMVFAAAIMMSPQPAIADTAAEIDSDVNSALQKLYDRTPAAKELSKVAKGILVFPGIVKGGLIIGGQYGEGALSKEGKTIGYYNTVAASYGLQAGVQKFGYAMFFMTESALKYLEKSDGWEIGVGPSVVIVDEGVAKSLSTTTAKSDIYAFFFDQKGLMAGLGLQGTKITKINKY